VASLRKEVANQLVLTAALAQRDALRYTPAGLPAVNLWLAHASETQEEGQARQITASVKAVAFGAVAEHLVQQAIGSTWCFSGFLASPRNSKYAVFHIQAFQQN
jgi:primosomal replication protein N